VPTYRSPRYPENSAPFYGAPPRIGVFSAFYRSRLFAAGRSHLHRVSAHSTGGDRLDNLVIIAIFLIAVAQVLTILLTIRRERDIRELGKLVDQQRLHIVELKAWLAGRNATQPRRLKSEREPIREPKADNAKASAPKGSTGPPQSRTIEDEAARAMNAQNRQRQILAGLRAGLKEGAPPEPVITRAPEPGITPKDSPDAMRPSATQDEPERVAMALKWPKDVPDEPRENVAAPEIVASLNGDARSPEAAIIPQELPDTVRPATAEDEFERVTKAINWLKEDADKAREILAGGTPPATKTG